jgi:hypothetical protein|tara:strand:+ start:566 stop:751 length:186 start_codon:yes stop_codon:yes gene_type:complete
MDLEGRMKMSVDEFVNHLLEGLRDKYMDKYMQDSTAKTWELTFEQYLLKELETANFKNKEE